MTTTVFGDVIIEKAVIGSIMLNNKQFIKLRQIPLLPSDFIDKRCSQLYTTIATLIEGGIVVDTVTLKNKHPELIDLIVECCETVPTSNAACDYGQIVKEAKSKRDIQRLLDDASKVCQTTQPIAETFNVLKEAEKIQQSTYRQAFSLSELSDEAFRWVEQNKKDVEMVTGIKKIDDVTGGLRRQSLVVYGAWLSNGKSAFLQHITIENLKRGKRVFYYTYELAAKLVYCRMVGIMGQVPIHKIMSPKQLSEQEQDTLNQYRIELLKYQKQLLIKEYTHIDILLNEIYQADLVVIDYLQPLAELTAGGRKLYDVHKEIMVKLRRSETFNNNCIVVGTQLTQPETESHRVFPLYKDTRDSKDIGNYTDMLLLGNWPYWHAVNGMESAVRKDLKLKDEWQEIPEDLYLIRVAKNNNGQVNKQRIKVSFKPETLTFSNMENGHTDY
ncbi:MAG: DnaB-like helicase C-terminal domain-containing protein [Planctomycetota bacterium]|nr:DnaB-like helicase C-terminal domain-containing protein [Planctomycetota bacterium]